MPDKNFKSYETFKGVTFTRVNLLPDNPKEWNDAMKVWRCHNCHFDLFTIRGGREDCIDVGQDSSGNWFGGCTLESNGQYIATIKGDSNRNIFYDCLITRHGKDVDFEFGNWHSLNFKPSVGNIIDSCGTLDGSPITYCYRWGCKPIIRDTKGRHLWWRSIGITAYWWGKYVWHRIFNRPDNY